MLRSGTKFRGWKTRSFLPGNPVEISNNGNVAGILPIIIIIIVIRVQTLNMANCFVCPKSPLNKDKGIVSKLSF